LVEGGERKKKRKERKKESKKEISSAAVWPLVLKKESAYWSYSIKYRNSNTVIFTATGNI
jgi:hypothetical protein